MSSEPEGLAAASTAHVKALMKADEEEISRAELTMLAIMMKAQFGNAEVRAWQLASAALNGHVPAHEGCSQLTGEYDLYRSVVIRRTKTWGWSSLKWMASK